MSQHTSDFLAQWLAVVGTLAGIAAGAWLARLQPGWSVEQGNPRNRNASVRRCPNRSVAPVAERFDMLGLRPAITLNAIHAHNG